MQAGLNSDCRTGDSPEKAEPKRPIGGKVLGKKLTGGKAFAAPGTFDLLVMGSGTQADRSASAGAGRSAPPCRGRDESN